MRKITYALILALGLNAIPSVHASDEPNEVVTEAGDILQFALPITAGLATLFEPDWEGTKQFAYSFGSAVIINSTAKFVVGKLRPNEANFYSYPSGHTMAAFSGAGFLMERYGPIYGWPALAAAGFVGYSRVQSYNHFADDVLAGASIGLMMNWVFVTPYEGRAKVQPAMINGEGFGMQLTILDREPNGPAGPEHEEFDPRFFYIFDFGPVYNTQNEIRSPLTSPLVDLTEFGDYDTETAASRVFLGWHITPKHIMALELAPFETRNKTTLQNDISFQGVDYAAGEVVRYSYQLYEARLRYMYNLHDNKETWLRIGAALSYYYNQLELESETVADKSSRNRTETVLPQLSANAGWWFAKKWALFGDINWGQMDGQRAQDLTVGVTWQISPQWNMSGGYRYYDRLIESDDWYNHLTQHQPFLSFGYAF